MGRNAVITNPRLSRSILKTTTSYILFTDVRGYSQLTNEESAVFHGWVLPMLADRLGRDAWSYANTWGDAIVFTIDAARTAANLALEMRDFFRVRDWEDVGLPPLEVRISVHRGEHFVGKDPFTGRQAPFGPALTLAARIEPVVTPGEVWITEDVALGVRRADSGQRSRFMTEEVGEIELAKGFRTERLYALRRVTDTAVRTTVAPR